ncbi:uncharacterized protein LOC116646637 [Phoca vitulina]|uniref:uncharacterized protein LOC116646637 n=1 Tax=Phoca vitulina TaxID=9720 RepID=UPI00139664A1|nr:uncharacterized protein LOC116646637 [Phoca vitulina]
MIWSPRRLGLLGVPKSQCSPSGALCEGKRFVVGTLPLPVRSATVTQAAAGRSFAAGRVRGFTAYSRGGWPLLSAPAPAPGGCAALLWGQRSRSRAGRRELGVGPGGCAARVTYCWGWPGHGVPSVAEATAAGDALASADGAAPPKHTLCSLCLFLFIFSTEQKTQTPLLSTGPTRTLPTGLRAHASWWCRREVLRPRPDLGRVSGRREQPPGGPGPWSPSCGSCDACPAGRGRRAHGRRWCAVLACRADPASARGGRAQAALTGRDGAVSNRGCGLARTGVLVWLSLLLHKVSVGPRPRGSGPRVPHAQRAPSVQLSSAQAPPTAPWHRWCHRARAWGTHRTSWSSSHAWGRAEARKAFSARELLEGGGRGDTSWSLEVSGQFLPLACGNSGQGELHAPGQDSSAKAGQPRGPAAVLLEKEPSRTPLSARRPQHPQLLNRPGVRFCRTDSSVPVSTEVFKTVLAAGGEVEVGPRLSRPGGRPPSRGVSGGGVARGSRLG